MNENKILHLSQCYDSACKYGAAIFFFKISPVTFLMLRFFYYTANLYL